jgi:hypothetical protein
VTVRGTERLVRELRNFQIDQFVFSSSMLVHAPCEIGWDPRRPLRSALPRMVEALGAGAAARCSEPRRNAEAP